MSQVRRYPGPQPFQDTPEDRRIFFGRTSESELISQQIMASPLTVMFGKSGLGKTSLLLAGVFPRLRNHGFLPVQVRLVAGSNNLVGMVEEAAGRAVEKIADVDFLSGEKDSLWEFCKTASFWQGDRLLTPVLVFDQFEEIFTLMGPEFRQGFAREVGTLLSGQPPADFRERNEARETRRQLSETPPQVRVVLSLREEYLAYLHELSRDIPGLYRDRIRLMPMSEEHARQAIQEPARTGSEVLPTGDEFATPTFEYEEDALRDMIGFLKGRSEFIEPFQLQILCSHVEDSIARQKAETQVPIRVDAKSLGGADALRQVMVRFYSDAMAGLVRNQRKGARELCEVGLLTESGNRLLLSEEQIRTNYKVSADTLEFLINRRVLRREPRLESMFYEICHDTLARSILEAKRWRLPRKYRLVLSGAATFVILIYLAGIGFTLKIQEEKANTDKEKAQAEKLVSFLIGAETMAELHLFGRLDILERVQDQVDDYIGKLSFGTLSTDALRIKGLAMINKGYILYAKGRLQQSLAAYLEAGRLFGSLSARADETSEWHRDQVLVLQKLGAIAADQFRLTDASRLHWEAIKLSETLSTNNPNENSLRHGEAESKVHLAKQLLMQGLVDEADQVLHEAIDSAPWRSPKNAVDFRPPQSHEEEVRWCLLLTDAYLVLSAREVKTGRIDRARDMQQQSQGWAQKAQELSQFSPSTQQRASFSKYQLAYITADPRQALLGYQQVLADAKRALNWDPQNVSWRRGRASVEYMVGFAYLRQQDWRDALAAGQRAQSQISQLVRIDASNKVLQSDLFFSQYLIALALQGLERTEEARRTFHQALDTIVPLTQIDATNAEYFGYLRDVRRSLASLLQQANKKAAEEMMAEADDADRMAKEAVQRARISFQQRSGAR